MNLKTYLFICYLSLIHALALLGLCQTLKIGLRDDFKPKAMQDRHLIDETSYNSIYDVLED